MIRNKIRCLDYPQILFCFHFLTKNISFTFRTSPAAPVIFQFDQSLIEDKDSLGNKLQPNSLTVDNLTVDWLRLKLTEFESSIKECQEKQTKLMENGTTITPAINGVNGGSKDMNK